MTRRTAGDRDAPRTEQDPTPPRGAPEGPELVAYRLSGEGAPACAPVRRTWMDATSHGFAYRCLPMVLANQAGWFVLNESPFEAIWDGGDTTDALRIRSLDEASPARFVSSHFGSGVLTWHIPYLFRTSPGYNLLARGPANCPKDGVQPLEGLVETDWSAATFTMNWKVTRTRRWVRFDAREPICMLVPQRRGELESFRTSVTDLSANPDLEQSYREWAESRKRFLALAKLRGSEAHERQWQKHYFRGRIPGAPEAGTEHQTGLDLQPFREADDAPPDRGQTN